MLAEVKQVGTDMIILISEKQIIFPHERVELILWEMLVPSKSQKEAEQVLTCFEGRQ